MLHELTKNGHCELRIDLEDFEGVTKYAVYKNFSVGDRTDGYRLKGSDYNGTAGWYGFC